MLSELPVSHSESERARDRERHREHDDQRMDEALELGREHQEHDQQRQSEGHRDPARGLEELLRLAGEAELGFGRQGLARDLLHEADRGAQVVALGERGRDRDRGQPVVAPKRRRGRAFAQLDQPRQRHQLVAGGRAHEDVGEIGRRAPVLGTRLDDHRVLATAIGVVGDLARGEHRLQGLSDGLGADAKVVRLVAIDHHVELRLVLLEVGLDVLQARIGLGALDDRLAPALDLAIVRTADHDLHRRPAAAQPEAGRARRERARARRAPRARESAGG